MQITQIIPGTDHVDSANHTDYTDHAYHTDHTDHTDHTELRKSSYAGPAQQHELRKIDHTRSDIE